MEFIYSTIVLLLGTSLFSLWKKENKIKRLEDEVTELQQQVIDLDSTVIESNDKHLAKPEIRESILKIRDSLRDNPEKWVKSEYTLDHPDSGLEIWVDRNHSKTLTDNKKRIKEYLTIRRPQEVTLNDAEKDLLIDLVIEVAERSNDQGLSKAIGKLNS